MPCMNINYWNTELSKDYTREIIVSFRDINLIKPINLPSHKLIYLNNCAHKCEIKLKSFRSHDPFTGIMGRFRFRSGSSHWFVGNITESFFKKLVLKVMTFSESSEWSESQSTSFFEWKLHWFFAHTLCWPSFRKMLRWRHYCACAVMMWYWLIMRCQTTFMVLTLSRGESEFCNGGKLYLNIDTFKYFVGCRNWFSCVEWFIRENNENISY